MPAFHGVGHDVMCEFQRGQGRQETSGGCTLILRAPFTQVADPIGISPRINAQLFLNGKERAKIFFIDHMPYLGLKHQP